MQPLLKVGMGLNMMQLEELRRRLRDNLQNFSANNLPSWWPKGFEANASVRPDLSGKELLKSVVLKVKAADLSPSN